MPQSLGSSQPAESLVNSTIIESKENEFSHKLGQPASSTPIERIPTPIPSDRAKVTGQPQTEVKLADLNEEDPTRLEASMESIFNCTAEEQ